MSLTLVIDSFFCVCVKLLVCYTVLRNTFLRKKKAI